VGRSLIVDDSRRVRKTLSDQLCLWATHKKVMKAFLAGGAWRWV